MIDSEDSTHDCSVIVQDLEDLTDSVDFSSTVTYSVDQTPVLTRISPRYGSVEGDTIVTFTGNWQSDNIADYTVTIDDLDCPVQTASSADGTITC